MFNLFLTLILTAVIALNVSCQSTNNKNSSIGSSHSMSDSSVSIAISSRETNDTGLSKTKEVSLNGNRNIEVLSINKEIKDSTAGDYSRCKAWSLTGKQIEFIIRDFEPMTSEEQYLSYFFYQCRLSGEIKIDGLKYKYWLGGGGTLTLKNNSTTLYYGCSGKKCREYFFSGKLTKKELN